MRLTTLLALVAGTLLASPASWPASAAKHDDWHLILVSGQPVGHSHDLRERVVEQGQELVRSLNETEMRVTRLGTEMAISSRTTYWETTSGRAERFESVMKLSAQELELRGSRTEAGFVIETSVMGHSERHVVPWSDAVLFPAGIDRALADAGFAPGRRLELETFALEAQKPSRLEVRMRDFEKVELLDGEQRELLRIDLEQAVMPGIVTTWWVDAEGQVLKSGLDLMGLELATLRTTRERALGKHQSVELLTKTLISIAAALPNPRALETAHYKLRSKSGRAVELPSDSRQSAHRLADGTILVQVEAEGWAVAASDPKPDSSYLDPSPMLQADDPGVKRMALAAVAGAETSRERARDLVAAVYKRIAKKNLGVGLASAAEVARSLSGDCTEHAVLLAGMARAVGIPSKVATGLVYYDGVFGYHMWTELYADGAWRSVDGAFGLEASDATHVKLAESPLEQGFLDERLINLVKLIADLELSVEEFTPDGRSRPVREE